MRLVPERDTLPRLLAFVYAPILLGIGALLNSGVARPDSLPPCALLNATGIACPTCGGTRAGLALWRLDLLDAFVQNPMVALGLLGMGLWFGASLVMTAAPGLRYAPKLDAREWRFVRRVAVGLLVSTWIYEIVRHLGAD